MATSETSLGLSDQVLVDIRSPGIVPDIVNVCVGSDKGDGSLVQTWTVPRALIHRNSSKFRSECASNASTWELKRTDPYAFELFIEWLYTGSYRDRDCKVDYTDLFLRPAPNEAESENLLDWRSRACARACAESRYLGCPAFHNYAMARLVVVYSDRHSSSAFLNPGYVRILIGASIRYGSIRRIFSDLVIRNWGDSKLINHADERWDSIFQTHPDLSARLCKALGVSLSLEDRRAQPLRLEDYLLPLDQNANVNGDELGRPPRKRKKTGEI